MNIILVGFMGSGKTTLARMLSKKHGFRFVDTDKLIEKRECMSISDIFKLKGEGYFREVERCVIDEELRFCDNCAIATGGGMPCFFDNMEKLKMLGWVIFLKAPFDVIIERIKDSSKRPLFKDVKKAEELYLKRVKCYSRAHFTVEVSDSKDGVLEKIEEIVFRGNSEGYN